MPNPAKKRARTGGSGFTIYQWNFGNSAVEFVSFARQVTDQSPTPVGPGTVPIHPMDAIRPDHLITPGAITMGTLTLEVYELVPINAWENFPGLEGAQDLADVFALVAGSTNECTIQKNIYDPAKRKIDENANTFTGNGKDADRTRIYHNCVISNIIDGESIEVGTMQVLKQVVVNYTHATTGTSGAKPKFTV